MIRRICLYGGPGVGKSVLAAKLFAELSIDGYQLEHITEYVKDWAYLKRKPTSFDQVYIFAKQMHREDLRLQYVPQVVTDSPLLTAAAYSKFYGFAAWQQIVELSNKFEEVFPSLNIILDRDGIEYKQAGRYQSYEQALEVDHIMSDMVYKYAPPSSIHVVRAVDFDDLKTLVKSVIQQSQGGN